MSIVWELHSSMVGIVWTQTEKFPKVYTLA